jgi:hypothetical protein
MNRSLPPWIETAALITFAAVIALLVAVTLVLALV